MKTLYAVDQETGDRHDCGVVSKKRQVGSHLVYLTYKQFAGKDDGMWWIVIQSETKLRQIGYVEDRREICWETFFALDEDEIARIDAQTEASVS